MSNTTYEQRLRALAEKMAKDQYDKAENSVNRIGIPFSDLLPMRKKVYTDMKMSDARIAVAEMAVQYEALYNELSVGDAQIIGFNNNRGEYKKYREGMDEILKEHGLIPDTEQEAEQDGNN